MTDPVQSLWAKYAPRIAEAQEEQAKEHTRAFHEFTEERIGDLPAILLTLRRYATMEESGCFNDGGDSPQVRIMRALWLLSPEFSVGNPNGKKFARKHRGIDFVFYGEELGAYLRRQFGEAKKTDDRQGRQASSSGGNWCASIIDTLASQYGWSEGEILDTPTIRVMAYINQITARITGNRHHNNPEADRLRQEFMDEANQHKKEAS